MAKSEKIQISETENSSARTRDDRVESGNRFVYKLVRLDLEEVRPSNFRSLWWRSFLRKQGHLRINEK